MAEISDRPITPQQVRAIHAAKSRAGMDEDAYRAMLHDRYGVTSSKHLTRRQASELLTRFGAKLPRPPGSGPAPTARRRAAEAAQATTAAPPPGSGVTRLPTPTQRLFIEDLVSEIEWREADGYRSWLQHTMKMERVTTMAQAAKVIEGLKAIKRRGRRVG